MSKKPARHETKQHLEAFELYVAQGGRRTLARVARALGAPAKAVQRWAQTFDWPARVRRRDAGNARKLARKTDESIVQVKARYHTMINKFVEALCRHHLGKDLRELRYPEKTTLTDLERLVRLDLMLLGQPDLVARLETGQARELDAALAALTPAELRALVGMARERGARVVEGQLVSSTEVRDEEPAQGAKPGKAGSRQAES